MADPGSNPWAPSADAYDIPADVAVAEPLYGARFGIRAAARIVDTIVRMIIGFVAGGVAGALIVMAAAAHLLPDGAIDRLGGLHPAATVLGVVGGLGYQALGEAIHGATLGKMLCGLRVVTVDGRRVGLGAAFVRNLAFFFDGLFFGLVGWSSMSGSALEQRYGDKWAGTMVVHAETEPEAARRSVATFFVALLASAMSSAGAVLLGSVTTLLGL